jgi:uncharacterized protein YoxC
MTPNEVFFGLIAVAIIALVVFMIVLILRLIEAVGTTRRLLETTGQSLQEVMGEVNQNLKSLKQVTDNLNRVADDLTSFSGSVKSVGDDVRSMTVCVKRVGEAVEDLSTEAAASVHGLRAGIGTGIGVLCRNLFQRRGG